MELELHQEHIKCFRPNAPMLLTYEETDETIVPDYCPDIARIVDTTACLQLRSQSAEDGRLLLSGSIRLTLLYMAESAPGLRSLEYSIPFEYSEKLPEDCSDASVEGRVCGVETRLLNPRKLFTRLNLEWRITPYCQAVLSTCGEILQSDRYSIQTLCEQYRVSLIRSVGGKDFVFSDELTLPGGKEAVNELLNSQVRLRITEVKSLGSKVILKGIACVSLLYAAESGKLCAYAEELPFSQILDGAGDEYGDASVSAVLNLTGSEIHTAGGEDRTVSVKLFLNAFVVVRSMQTVDCISDLYSTAYDLKAQMDTVILWQEPKIDSVIQSVREQIDTGTEIKCVLLSDVCFGGVSVRQEGGRALLRASAQITVLYLDEADVPLALKRQLEISTEAPADDEALVSVDNVCAGEIAANINGSGLELRFPAEFTLISAPAPSVVCLAGLSAEELPPSSDSPSLVLRGLSAGESLWDVAKQYRTTVEEILSANELTESSVIEAGQMLLIPRKR